MERQAEKLQLHISALLRDSHTPALPVNDFEGDCRALAEGINALGKRMCDAENLLVSLVSAISLGIAVVDTQTQEELLCNEKAKELLRKQLGACQGVCAHCERQPQKIFARACKDPPCFWEISCAKASIYYQVNVHAAFWQGREARILIIDDLSRYSAPTTALAQRVYRDDLTSLYNRRYCVEQINDCIQGGGLFTLAYFDIDNLKHVNDVFGHLEGDEYIRVIVDAVQRSIRADDIFARTGGDEFLVLFRDTPASVVENKFKTIVETIRAKSHTVKPYCMSVSYGVMEIRGEQNLDVDTMLRAVDEKMYQYKRAYKPKPTDASAQQNGCEGV